MPAWGLSESDLGGVKRQILEVLVRGMGRATLTVGGETVEGGRSLKLAGEGSEKSRET